MGDYMSWLLPAGETVLAWRYGIMRGHDDVRFDARRLRRGRAVPLVPLAVVIGPADSDRTRRPREMRRPQPRRNVARSRRAVARQRYGQLAPSAVVQPWWRQSPAISGLSGLTRDILFIPLTPAC